DQARTGFSSTGGQILQWIDGFSLAANLEVKLDAIRTGGSHFRNHLSDLDLLPLLYQKPAVMTVGTNKGVAVLDDHQFTVATKPATGVHNGPTGRSQNRLAQFTSQINAFIQTAV